MFKSGKKAIKEQKPLTATTAAAVTDETSDTALFLKSLQDPDIIERVRVTIKNAHVFKLPPRQTVSVGWRGADWNEKVWQGTVKVVERGDQTAALLVDKVKGSIFAVCPIKEGAVERCIDSSRYFVLRIENATGRHMFIGVAFNERNDAFDFNTAMEDSRREREAELAPSPAFTGPSKDYSIKDGEKIRVAIPNLGTGTDKMHEDFTSGGGTEAFANFFDTDESLANQNISPDKKVISSAAERRRAARAKGTIGSASGGGLLVPSSRDTPSRTSATSEEDLVQADASPPSAKSGFFDNFGKTFSSAFG